MRSKAPSSSPGRPCSGCETDSASSTARPRPVLSPRRFLMPAGSSWSPPLSAWGRPTGIPSPAERSLDCRVVPKRRTSSGRPLKRWPTRPAMSSTRCRATPAGRLTSCGSTAARRSWTCCVSSRRTCLGSRSGVRGRPKRRPWARLFWPAWAPACGLTPTWPHCGSWIASSSRPSPEIGPHRCRRSGGGPLSAAATGLKHYRIISSLSSNGGRPIKGRQRILYAEEFWRWQRFYAGLLIVVGIIAVGAVLYSRAPISLSSGTLLWLFYAPVGLLLAGAFYVYRLRSYVEPLENGLRVSTLYSGVLIDYESIRMVKVQPLKIAFQDDRRKRVVRIMKPLLEKPALFVRVRGDEQQLALIKKRLGSRLFYEDTIAIPIADPDAASWEIASRLPYRIGQNLGGGRRKKRRR